MTKLIFALATFVCGAILSCFQIDGAKARGDEWHQVVAGVAQSLLEPDVRKRVNALLAADTDSLASHNMLRRRPGRANIANIGNSRERTQQWHFVDIEISAPGPSLFQSPHSTRREARIGRTKG
ncbi:hypothetical protein ABIB99_007037 [Bradyrhizobium sp. LA6.1]|uniref:hypothetical protein n=1 Tax=Bradyrhizobium sp. LA6.1 TaxID=3156378 RepID=UPI003395BEC5